MVGLELRQRASVMDSADFFFFPNVTGGFVTLPDGGIPLSHRGLISNQEHAQQT